MDTFFQLIHQRASIPTALAALEKAKSLNSVKFVAQVDVVRSRNPFYAKKLLKALSEQTQLIDKKTETSVGAGDNGESNSLELTEWVFEQYVELLAVNPPDPVGFTDIIRYSLGCGVEIDVEEQPLLLSAAGTTGNRTWKAALYLGELLAQKDPILGDLGSVSKVLELGTGTGLVSMVWAKVHGSHTKELYITDGNSRLIEQCTCHNFRLNGFNNTENFKFQRLYWGEDDVPEVDLVLASDVTYDITVVPVLAETLATALRKGARFALIAATVRNEKTNAEFESQCANNGLAVEVVSVKPVEMTPIRIYKLSTLA
ncbi:LAME_0A04434g1_1 [Lachancea meyersii CBS 8951]|uniref:LAME_0A04434g1_1 n=1 Tax=Lachancea meyersii CBS 8951 TaxID=1266667 RepID=A0A1G4IPJ8_9SACH|nr:LAME_0A04434g1_1 [Lachancea meyersii CBS 8951]